MKRFTVMPPLYQKPGIERSENGHLWKRFKLATQASLAASSQHNGGMHTQHHNRYWHKIRGSGRKPRRRVPGRREPRRPRGPSDQLSKCQRPRRPSGQIHPSALQMASRPEQPASPKGIACGLAARATSFLNANGLAARAARFTQAHYKWPRGPSETPPRQNHSPWCRLELSPYH